MPPSPAMRYSPGREPRDGKHKRGRSFEGLIPFREKDDDLALFNEVQSKEKGNFLLQSNDDFDHLFSSKLRNFSDHKLGISIPSRGESSNLLNAEGEKNDYDWLLTPPDTPLFTYLDDETPPVNLPLRGRARSQPISISRSSTMEKSHQSIRGSASPNRLSPSPRSIHSTSQSRGRPSSLPPPSLRNATPTRRPSPPPSKPSTPAPRSSTPSPGRTSTGSSEPTVPSCVRGNSPAKSGRRNSTSPKIKAWQANIPGFSSEVPPNLRTSLGDRQASYVRGSSPASRNGSKSGRQSMSPTPSRSVSSWNSHEKDKLNSNVKGSVASSGDDDMESLLSIPVSSSDHSAPGSLHTSSNVRSMNSSKKPTRIVATSSAPKRSIDMAMRQMDQRKSPHNMFRPLLSSVPSSTSYGCKSGAMCRTIASRNSSVTTSSNTSSDMGLSVEHGTEGSELNQEDLTSEHVKLAYHDMQEEVFSFDHSEYVIEYDQIHEGMPHKSYDEINPRTQLGTQLIGDETCKGQGMTTEISAASEALDEKSVISTDNAEVLCSKCGSRFRATDIIEGEPKLCKDCKGSGIGFVITVVPKKLVVDMDSPGVSGKSVDYRSLGTFPPSVEIPESTELTVVRECETIYSEEEISDSEPHENLMLGRNVGQHSNKEGEQILTKQHLVDQHMINSHTVDEDNNSKKLLNFNSYLNCKTDFSEGAGIPLLLRSSSGKGLIVRSRHFTATSITFDDFSYMRDSATSTRSSFGHGSASASSSIDLGSKTCVLRQLSGRKSDNENYKSELYVKHQHSVSSLSETSPPAFPIASIETSCHEENFEVSSDNAEKEIVDASCVELQELAMRGEAQEADSVETESNGNWRTVSDLSSSSMNMRVEDASVTPFSNFQDCELHDSDTNMTNSCMNVINHDTSSTQLENCHQEVDVAEAPNLTSLVVISEIVLEEDDVVSPDSVFDVGSQNSKSSLDDLQESSPAAASCNDIVSSGENSIPQNHAQSTLEESIVMLDGQGGNHRRGFTLEEATDAILFCRSIVHNLAYDAASIAIEKDASVPLEVFQPVASVVSKSNPDRRDPRSRTVARRNSKSQKPRQRTVETVSNPPTVTANNERVDVSSTRIVGANKGDTTKPPKLESKCNCVIM